MKMKRLLLTFALLTFVFFGALPASADTLCSPQSDITAGRSVYGPSGTVYSLNGRGCATVSNTSDIAALIAMGYQDTSTLQNNYDYLAANQLPPMGSYYTGVVAAGGAFPNLISGSYTQFNSRTPYVMRGNMPAGQNIAFVFPWVYANPGVGETAPAANATCTGSLEYPAGTFQQMTTGNGASTQMTITAGSYGVSDAFATPPPVGAVFWIRSYCTTTGSGRVVWRSYPMNISLGAALQAGTSLTDLTMGGTIPQTCANPYPGPTANSGAVCTIYAPMPVGLTNSRSFCLTGESRDAGLYDSFDGGTDVDIGQFLKSTQYFAAGYNIGIGSDTGAAYISSHTVRLAMSQYCSDEIWSNGLNDIYTNNATAATVEGYATTFLGYFAGTGKNVDIATQLGGTLQNSVTFSALTYNGNAETLTITSAAGMYNGETITIAATASGTITPSTAGGTCTIQAINSLTASTTVTCFNPLSTGSGTATSSTTTFTYSENWSNVNSMAVSGPSTSAPNMTAVNNWCRLSYAANGFHACLEISDQLSSGRDSNIWDTFDSDGNSGPITLEGGHPSVRGYLKIRRSGAVSARTLN